MTEQPAAESLPTTAIAELPLAELRPRLVQAMLVHVPFDGWSKAALRNALRDLGLPESLAEIAFPGGAVQMVDCFTAAADAAMLAAADTLQALKVRDRVAGAIRLRLQQAAPYRDAVRRAVTLLALPSNAPAAARLAWRTADAIWRAAGDSATDFSHYTKRATAAAVYTSTLLYWLGDDSPGQIDSMGFLERRIGNVMQFHSARTRLRDRLPAGRPRVAEFLGRLRYRSS